MQIGNNTNLGTSKLYSFTGDGLETSFIIGKTVSDLNSIDVYIEGLRILNSEYSISYNSSTGEYSIVFTVAPALNDVIIVKIPYVVGSVAYLGNGFGLFDTKITDYVLNEYGWALQGSTVDGLIFEDAYNHLLDDYNNSTDSSETVAGVSITYRRAADGHKIIDIVNKVSMYDALYSVSGTADYYLIDTVTPQFILPKSDWLHQLTTSTSNVNNYNNYVSATGSDVNIKSNNKLVYYKLTDALINASISNLNNVVTSLSGKANISLNNLDAAGNTILDGKALKNFSNITQPRTALDNIGLLRNRSLTSQILSASSRNYIAGSELFINGKQVAGAKIRWMFDVTKTAAGTATSTIDIALGTTGSTADSAVVSFTKPAGTAVIDNGRYVIEAIIRGVSSSTGEIVGHLNMTHNLSTTGLANIPCVNITTITSSLDTLNPTYIGLCYTPGASEALTIQMVESEVILF